MLKNQMLFNKLFPFKFLNNGLHNKLCDMSLKFHSKSLKNKMGFKWNVETQLVGRNSLRLNTEINEDNNKEPKTCKCR